MKSNIATSPTHHSGLRFQILEGSKGVVGEILKSWSWSWRFLRKRAHLSC